MPPSSFHEDHYRQQGLTVCGIDEAGRGPWAGPVVAAAVILPLPGIALPEGIEDSKRLSAARRERLFDALMALAGAGIGVGEASVEEIDRLNILGATKLAMQRAYAALPFAPDAALVDGNQPPRLPCLTQAIIKGDSLSLSIASASIIAKVTRDRLMAKLAHTYPHYGWERNAGYGVAQHREGLATHGVTPHHRTSFAPIKHYRQRQVISC